MIPETIDDIKNNIHTGYCALYKPYVEYLAMDEIKNCIIAPRTTFQCGK